MKHHSKLVILGLAATLVMTSLTGCASLLPSAFARRRTSPSIGAWSWALHISRKVRRRSGPPSTRERSSGVNATQWNTEKRALLFWGMSLHQNFFSGTLPGTMQSRTDCSRRASWNFASTWRLPPENGR